MRRVTRGWGPFSGGQLTIIIVMGAVLILFPVSAFAVASGSNVFVTDHTTGVRARVDGSGKLDTNATVSGSVVARPAAPDKLFSHSVTSVATGGTCMHVAAPPAGHALVVTSVEVSVITGAPLSGIVTREPVAICTPVDNPDIEASVGLENEPSSFVVPFPSGVPIPQGDDLNFSFTTTGSTLVVVSVHGYLVAASVCESPNVCAS